MKPKTKISVFSPLPLVCAVTHLSVDKLSVIVGLNISCEQIPGEEREPLGVFSFPADVGKRLEDVGSAVKLSCVCG